MVFLVFAPNYWILILIKSILSALSMGAVTFSVSAELQSLDDFEMDQVTGAGLAIVLEDFAFEAGQNIAGANNNQLDISGLRTSDGRDVVLGVSQFYVAGSGSNQGQNVIGNGVNLGRLDNPYQIDLLNGNDIGIDQKAVLELAAPRRVNGDSVLVQRTQVRSQTCSTGVACTQRFEAVTGIDLSKLSSRTPERADFGVKYDINFDGVPQQSLETHATGVALDGSYLRLWGDNNRMVGALSLKLYADDLTIFATNADGTNQGSSVVFDDLVLEADLGYGDRQPLEFEVESDGNFEFLIGGKTRTDTCKLNSGNCNNRAGFADFYNQGPKINIHVNDVRVGNNSFGTSTISNLQIQYLKVNSRDL